MPQCPVCPKSFPSPYKLQRHYVTHTGQRPFICKLCGKAFTQAEHLRTHLQKVQHSRLPADRLQDGILTPNQQPNCSKPAAVVNTHGKSNITVVTWTVASQPEWKREIVTNTFFLPSSETENAPQNMPHVNDGSVTQNSISNVMDAIPQEPPTSHRTPVNSSVEVELQCKISVNAVQDLNEAELKSDAVVKTEQPLHSSSQRQSICLKSDEQEQRYLTYKDLKPFQCMSCNRSFRLEVNLIRHREIHWTQKELGSPATVQNSDNVIMSDSEAIKHVPEPCHADPVDLNVIVKSESSSENRIDRNGSLPLGSEFMTSAEQQAETCRASRQQRINTLHQCRTCLKCFPSVSKLQRHTMTHTGQRPFGCEMCGKRFRQTTHLRVHCRTHLWSRYHKQRSLYINRPPSCIGGFNTRTAADVPVQEVLTHKKDFETHTGSDVISVKQTPTMVNIQIDKRKSDNSLLPHTSKRNVVSHLRNVSKVTVKRTQAAKSMRNPGNVQHKCSRCLKCFPSASKLERHEMVHTGLKPFQCLMCGKAFSQVPHLKTHQRTHCERKLSKPVTQQRDVRKLKANCQQQHYTRISVRITPQKKSGNTDATLGNGVSALLCTRREIFMAKANSLFKTNSESNVTCKKRKLHTCRICFKNFVSPCKLSRHLVTHSGMRPHKRTLCSETFARRGHRKVYEHRGRQSSVISHYIQGEMTDTDHLQDKCLENLTNCTLFDVDAAREQPESHYTSVGHDSFTDGDLSYCSEPVDTEWLAVPEVRLQEDCNQAVDHYGYSFPSELAFEIHKLVQNQNMAAPPLSHEYESNAHNVEVPCQPKGVTAMPGSNKLLSDELVGPVVENQMQPDDYWWEPLTVFDCDKCTARFNSKNNFKQHICSTNVEPKVRESAQKNRCDICFKYFVSPSKLKRHYLIHTGQRPFRCDICGKTFTQSAHVRTHRLTH